MKKKGIRKEKCIVGQCVVLEPFAERHLSDEYLQWLNNPEVCRWNSHGESKYSLLQARKYLKSIRSDAHKKVFAILMKQDKRHVGNISLYISPQNNSGEIAILIGATECWGKGVGTEAFRLVMEYAFNSLKLHRIYAGIASKNTGMIRVVQKLGFHNEGVQRDAFLKKGRYWDVLNWALLNRGNK